MAARENQGYLIAVIILVVLALILALVSFLGIQKAYEQAEVAAAADAKLNVALKIAQAEGLKGEAFKAAIGDMGVAPAEIDKAINDLQGLSANRALTDADKKIIADILAEVRTVKEVYDLETQGNVSNGEDEAAKVATLRSRITDLTALADRIRNDYKTEGRRATEAAEAAAAKIVEAKKGQKLAQDEKAAVENKLAEAQAEFLDNQKMLQGQVAEFKKAFNEANQKIEEVAQQAAASLREAKNKIGLLEVDNVTLKNKLNEFTNEVFDHADGEVIRVASGLNTVFIDIGSADGLTSNRTFSVFDQSVTDFESATAKATIEVVRVDTFRAEARITHENSIDPVIRGDHILTATWDPGFTVKLALAGRFDLDGDRFDDTEKLIQMIERNGGEVVASHDLKGKVTGKISSEVRYLVKGNQSLIGGQDDDPDASAILNTVSDMEKDAVKNTVQVIDLQKLLNRMGVRARPKTQQRDFPQGGFVPRQPGAVR